MWQKQESAPKTFSYLTHQCIQCLRMDWTNDSFCQYSLDCMLDSAASQFSILSRFATLFSFPFFVSLASACNLASGNDLKAIDIIGAFNSMPGKQNFRPIEFEFSIVCSCSSSCNRTHCEHNVHFHCHRHHISRCYSGRTDKEYLSESDRSINTNYQCDWFNSMGML